MYIPLFNRLCGWVCFSLGIVGLTSGQVGDYAHISSLEGWTYLTVGLIGMTGARLRWRDSMVLGVIVVLCNAGLAALGWSPSAAGMITVEPAQSALHTVIAAWGLMAVIIDVKTWLSRITQ